MAMNSNWPHADALALRASLHLRLFEWGLPKIFNPAPITLTLRDVCGVTDTLETRITFLAPPDLGDFLEPRASVIHFRSEFVEISCHTPEAAIWLLGDLWPDRSDPVTPPTMTTMQIQTPTEIIDHGSHLESRPDPYEKPFTFINLW